MSYLNQIDQKEVREITLHYNESNACYDAHTHGYDYPSRSRIVEHYPLREVKRLLSHADGEIARLTKELEELKRPASNRNGGRMSINSDLLELVASMLNRDVMTGLSRREKILQEILLDAKHI